MADLIPPHGGLKEPVNCMVASDDVGRVKLGVLEPAPEYVLFTLGIDGVGGPVDTPRGYWIVKRLE